MAQGGKRFPTVPGIEVEEIVGRGGFATVYRARQSGLERTVALKVIHPGLHADPDMLRRFERECRAIGSLTGHPTVMTVFEVGQTEDDDPFMVLEYLPNGSLQEQLFQTGPMPWPEVLRVGIAVCRALESAHELGIIHRDVKPANVLSDRYGTYKLGDFGIAGMGTANSTSLASTAATVAYAAPEILLGKRATVSSDLYGLGAMLYALLAGAPAFTSDTDEGMVPMMLRVTTTSLEPLPKTIGPPQLLTLVEALMAKEPIERPQTAAEVLERLQQIQTTVGLLATANVADGWADPAMTQPGPVPLPPVTHHTPVQAPQQSLLDSGETRPVSARLPPTSVAAPDQVEPGRIDGSDPRPDPFDRTTVRRLSRIPEPTRPSGLAVSPVITPSAHALTPNSVGNLPGPETRETAAAPARTDRRRAPAAIAAIAVLLLGVGIIASVASGRSNGSRTGTTTSITRASSTPAKTSVPKVIGLPESEAAARLRAAGFKTLRASRYDGNVAAGRIANQVPAPSAAARRGSTVHLAVSKGPAPKVPNVIGLFQQDATRALFKAGFTHLTTTTEASEQPAGQVLRVQPGVGAATAKEATIRLIVSSGPAPVEPASSSPTTARPTGTTGTTTTTQVTSPTATHPPTTRPPTTSCHTVHHAGYVNPSTGLEVGGSDEVVCS